MVADSPRTLRQTLIRFESRISCDHVPFSGRYANFTTRFRWKRQMKWTADLIFELEQMICLYFRQITFGKPGSFLYLHFKRDR